MSCKYCLTCKIDKELQEWSKTKSIRTASEICEMLLLAKTLSEGEKGEESA